MFLNRNRSLNVLKNLLVKENMIILFSQHRVKIYDQKLAKKFLTENLMIIAGHYKGVDDRVRNDLQPMKFLSEICFKRWRLLPLPLSIR